MNAVKKIDDHQSSLRDIRARKILAAARASLVGHVSRDDRVAAALTIARANVLKFKPKRLASTSAFASVRQQQLERQAAAARQDRVKRTLSAARDTLARTAYIKPPSDTARDAHVAPEAPSPTSRGKEAAPLSGVAMEDLGRRFEVLREAVPQAMGDMIANLRIEWQRENDLLRRELDVTHRELDSVRRTVADLRARPS